MNHFDAPNFYLKKKDPKAAMTEMFGHMGINKDYVSLALEALNYYSQSGMKLAERGGLEEFSLDEKTMDNVDKIYKDFGVQISCRMTREEFVSAFSKSK